LDGWPRDGLDVETHEERLGKALGRRPTHGFSLSDHGLDGIIPALVAGALLPAGVGYTALGVNGELHLSNIGVIGNVVGAIPARAESMLDKRLVNGVWIGQGLNCFRTIGEGEGWQAYGGGRGRWRHEACRRRR